MESDPALGRWVNKLFDYVVHSCELVAVLLLLAVEGFNLPCQVFVSRQQFAELNEGADNQKCSSAQRVYCGELTTAWLRRVQ